MALIEKLTAIADAIRVQSGKTDKLTLDQMPSEIIDLQSLGFEIVGNPQPSNPKANTIWIDTDATITGWVFDMVRPAAPSDGMVWICTGATSPAAFNALKKNGIIVYPMSAEQYIGGVWVKKAAKSYQNGQWVGWIPAGALYYEGDECVQTSGGWQARGLKPEGGSYRANAPTKNNTDKYMEITPPWDHWGCGVVDIVSDQDFTNVDRLTIDYEGQITQGIVELCLINRSAQYLSAVRSIALFSSGVGEVQSISRTTVSLDVSGVTGMYDVALSFVNHWAGSTTGAVKVYSVIMESAVMPPGDQPDGQEIQATHDGNGNVYLSGVSGSSDGSGNVTIS